MAVVWTDTPLIKKITLPSGNTYFIADRESREKIEQLFETISGGVSFVISWDGTSAPTVASIPAGVVVTYNDTDYTGTMAADSATPGAFYLVKSSTASSGTDIYDEYVPVGNSGSKTWEKIGDTQMDLSDVVFDVTLNKQTSSVVTGYESPTTDVALGEATTFALTDGAITFGTPTTDTFVKSVTAETNKNLVTTSVTGVQSTTTTASRASGPASKVTAATDQTTVSGFNTSTTNTDILKGVSVSNEVLTLGAATPSTQTTTQFTAQDVTFTDVDVPVKDADATTVATGTTSTSGTGDAVVTGVTIGSSAAALTALPTATVGTGITVGTNDKVTTLIGLGTPTTATVLNNTTDLTVTKGS